MAVKFSAFTTRTGTLDASTKIVGYDDPAGTKTNVEFSLATLAANSGIYGADGTIGTTRKALITDTIQFRNAGDTSDVLSLNTNGNVEISGNTGMGVAVDTAVTLKVDASGPNDQMAIIAKGRDQAAGDYSLICQDSAATNLFIVENDGLVTVGKNLKVSGQGYTELHAQTSNDLQFNWDDGNIQTATSLTGSHTFTPSNQKAGATYIISLGQSGTVTATWTGVRWPGGTAPTLSGAGKTDVITLICYDAAANYYYGSAVLDLA